MNGNNYNLIESDLPHNTEAEQCVLGAVLADPSLMPMVMENIRSEFFYSPQHKAIYSVIVRMFSSGENADVITVVNEVERLNIFESPAQCRKYFAAIAETLPTTANIESYCKIVADKYYIRSLGIAARAILHEIQSNESDAQKLIDSAEQKIYGIRQGKDVEGLVKISDAICEAYDRLGKITGPDKEKYVGAKTGFSGLDTITSGLNKSDLIIIAARPGMGKTSFAMNIASNVARHNNKQIVIFSLEMSSEQLATRLLSTEAKIDSKRFRSGRIPNEDWIKLATSAGYLSNLPMLIGDSGGITVQQMKAKLRRVKNLGLVVIDYLQLMESTSKSDNRVVVVSEITRQLKLMARELDVPVILLSQLSRNPDQRTDKRPQLSDLRESGSIEQDADIVLFLYRESYYNKECEKKNIAQCIIAKNRHGELGSIDLYWDGNYTRFSDLNRISE